MKNNEHAFSEALDQLQTSQEAAARMRCNPNRSLCVISPSDYQSTSLMKAGQSCQLQHTSGTSCIYAESCSVPNASVHYNSILSSKSTDRSASPQNVRTLQVDQRMDYAKKRKLLQKRRELTERAKKVLQGKKSSTSTSIIANRKALNFNDIKKMEKE